MSQVKAQKKIMRERIEREKKMQMWVANNTLKALPKFFQKSFERATYRMIFHSNRFAKNGFTMSSLKLPLYYMYVNGLLKLFGVTLKFSTEENGAVINVATFKRGKYFDSYIRPEDYSNGNKKKKAVA